VSPALQKCGGLILCSSCHTFDTALSYRLPSPQIGSLSHYFPVATLNMALASGSASLATTTVDTHEVARRAAQALAAAVQRCAHDETARTYTPTIQAAETTSELMRRTVAEAIEASRRRDSRNASASTAKPTEGSTGSELAQRAQKALDEARRRIGRDRAPADIALESRALRALQEAQFRQADVNSTSKQKDEAPTTAFRIDWYEDKSASGFQQPWSEDTRFAYEAQPLWSEECFAVDEPARMDLSLRTLADRSEGVFARNPWFTAHGPCLFSATLSEETCDAPVAFAWAETTTAADSASDIGHCIDAGEDSDADELLASCWKVIDEPDEMDGPA
jgi:hypothetical protein